MPMALDEFIESLAVHTVSAMRETRTGHGFCWLVART